MGEAREMKGMNTVSERNDEAAAKEGAEEQNAQRDVADEAHRGAESDTALDAGEV